VLQKDEPFSALLPTALHGSADHLDGSGYYYYNWNILAYLPLPHLMPIFDYLCSKCDGARVDHFVQKWSDEVICEGCQSPMERHYSLGVKHRAASVFPFVTRNIRPDGKPVEVTSSAHMESLCKEFGVRHRPDVGWLEDEFQGYDFRTKQQKWKQGTGMGLPGVWI
jgi:hypothetical protein